MAIQTPTDFANALLGKLHKPDTKTNVANIVGWEHAEGGAGPQFGIANNDDNYNPINTTLAEPGSRPTNASGVQSYTSWQEGLDATASTLQAGNYGYPAILDALSKSAPWTDFAGAVSASSWGTTLDPSPVAAGPSSSAAEAALYNSGASTDPIPGTPGSQKKPQDPNKPGDAVTGHNETGFAGVLQNINQWYNPPSTSLWTDITSLGSAPLQSVATMIFTRAASSVLFLGITIIGVMTLLRTEGPGGISGGTNNVLEFVNQQQTGRRQESRINLATEREARLRTQHTESAKEEAYGRKHEDYVPTRRRSRQHKTSRIYHYSNKGES